VAVALKGGDSDLGVAIWWRTNEHNFDIGTSDEDRPLIMCLSRVDGGEALRRRRIAIGYGHESIVRERFKYTSPSPALTTGTHDANIHALPPWDGGTRRRRV
jgi:hypothetical protein